LNTFAANLLQNLKSKQFGLKLSKAKTARELLDDLQKKKKDSRWDSGI